jgi:predicted DNA-binding protein (UPF0251 family)
MKMVESITISDAAIASGVSRQAIHKAIAAGRLKTVEVMIPRLEITIESFQAFKPNPKMRNCGPKATKKKAAERNSHNSKQ